MTLDVEQFRRQFFLQGKPFWSAHNASRSAEKIGEYVPDQEYARNHEDVMIFSWMQLEEFFTNFGSGGTGKFQLRKNKTDNVRTALTIYVRWGAPTGLTPSVAGIGNSVVAHHAEQPSWAMMFQLQEKNNVQNQELMKELMETKFQIQLRDTLAELGGTEEPTVQDRLIDIGTQIASAYLLGGAVPQLPGQLGTLGVDGEVEPAPAPAAAPGNETAAPTERPVSHDQMVRAAEMIAANVPYHPNDVFNAMALSCQNNPEQAAGYIGMMINQVKQAAAAKQAADVG